jgi:hypothetical protein
MCLKWNRRSVDGGMNICTMYPCSTYFLHEILGGIEKKNVEKKGNSPKVKLALQHATEIPKLANEPARCYVKRLHEISFWYFSLFKEISGISG